MGKKKVGTEQLDEGLKDVVVGALMSLSFLTTAEAQEIGNSITSINIPASKMSAMIKSADNKAEVESIIKSYTTGEEDIEIDKNISKPSGYIPLTTQQREDWNEYLKFLVDKGIAGSPELDKGLPTKGNKELDNYLKANPNSSLNKFKSQDALVKSIQYEMQVIRRGDNASDLGLDPNELKAMQNLLLKTREPFMMVNRSKMDGNPGQFTTQEYYPVFGDTGTDYKKSMPKIYKSLNKTPSK